MKKLLFLSLLLFSCEESTRFSLTKLEAFSTLVAIMDTTDLLNQETVPSCITEDNGIIIMDNCPAFFNDDFTCDNSNEKVKVSAEITRTEYETTGTFMIVGPGTSIDSKECNLNFEEGADDEEDDKTFRATVCGVSIDSNEFGEGVELDLSDFCSSLGLEVAE